MTEEQKIIENQNKNTEIILKSIEKLNANYHELCTLKDIRITDLEEENKKLQEQIEKMKCCAICKYFGNFGICLNNEECHNKDKFELEE